jgi:hypothetical protein
MRKNIRITRIKTDINKIVDKSDSIRSFIFIKKLIIKQYN